jgi:hypothetical protein
MALGTRTPNERNLSDVYAGLPRDLNAELATKTAAKLAAVFCPKTTAKPRPNTKPKNAGARHLTPLSTRGYGMEAKPQCSRRRRDLHG